MQTDFDVQMQTITAEKARFAAAMAKSQAKGDKDAEAEAEKAARRANRLANHKAGFSGQVFGNEILFLTKTFTTGSVGFHGTGKVIGPDGKLYQVNVQAVQVGSK